MEHLQITTADGHTLAADVIAGDVIAGEGAAGEPADRADARAGVVVCHPHPQYGGTRHDRVVTAVFEALPPHGITTLRFDFRRAFGGGVDEVLDVEAALDAVAARVPAGPLHLVGYSFGAMVALGVDHPRLASRVAVAPPLAAGTPPPPAGPTLVLVAEHDQFCPPDAARAVVSGWPGTTLEVVPMADHFLAGATAPIATTITTWLSRF